MRVQQLVPKSTLVAIAALGALALAGCADTTWEAARKADSVAAYHRFLRENPDSDHARDAEERLAYLRVRTHRTLESFEEFQRTYPQSALLPELRQNLEDLVFEGARAQNTPEAYRTFLQTYPRGRFSDRATGNLHYVEHVRGSADAAVLRSFVGDHPSSDFVEEAKRTLELIAFRESSRIERLGVRVEVPSNIDQPQRVERGFLSIISQRYRELGVEVEPLDTSEIVPTHLQAWMRVDYHEAPASGVLGGSTLFSHCRVRLYHKDVEEPIWDRTFEAPADHVLKGAYGRDKTVFGNAKYRFWEQFFVPVSTWATSSTRVQRLQFNEEVRDVDLRNDIAVILLDRGGIDLYDVSEPLSPERVGRYRRESDLSTWQGVEILDDTHVVMFGADGAEVVERNPHNVLRIGRWDGPEIGRIRGAARFNDGTMLLGGSEGLYAVRFAQRPLAVHRLLDGEIVGVEVIGGLAYIARRETLEVASPKHLLRHVTGAKIALGTNFDTTTMREVRGRLYLFGRDALVELNLDQPTRPQVGARFAYRDLGGLRDVAADAWHLYLLGDRGLQVADAQGRWVSDFIQVEADHSIKLGGRYAFLAGERALEIVDLGPYQAAANAAEGH